MNGRRWTALALCLSLVTCLLTGCGSSAASEEEGAPAAEERVQTNLDGELQRAADAGLLPEEWLGDLGAPVTFQEYAELTGLVIERWNEIRLADWQAIAAQAALSQEEMAREDGFLLLSYAWVLMERNREDIISYNLDETINPELVYTEEMRDGQQGLSWDYPLFPNWEDVVYDVYKSNYMWGAVCVFPMVLSPTSGESMFTWDENGSLELDAPLTRRDAVLALERMAEYCRIEMDESWRDYVPLSEAGSYDRSILTDELLSAPTDLPEVTQAQLPAEWHGAGIGYRKSTAAEYTHFRETDIRFLAENGFNFVRLFFSFETLRYPDYPADPTVVNRRELLELDQLLAWCIQYGVHLQISMNGYLAQDGSARNQQSEMPQSEEEWAITRDHWELLARRYAGISSRYLTFDLANETEPGEDELDAAQRGLAGVVEAIRQADSSRVLLYSLQDSGSLAWTERFAALGVAVGCHPYAPSFIATTDYAYREMNPYAEPCWPQPYFPMGLAMEGEVPIIIRGDVEESILSFHISTSNESPLVSVYGDGALLETIVPTDGILNEEGEYVYGDVLYSVEIPTGTEEITIQVGQGGHYTRLDTIILEKGDVRTVMVPSDTGDYPDLTAPLPLIINGDGTYTNSENQMMDIDYIYETAVKPYQDIAKRYGVGFMVNEFGMFGTKVYWDIDVVTAFHETYLEMLEQYQLPWCYCESANVWPKHLIILYGEASQWAGATVEEVTYSYEDGREDTLRVCEELLAVFRSHLAS